jgi:psiF repeat
MSKFSRIALVLLFASFSAQAADPAATPIKTAPPVQVAATGSAQKTTAISQQDKMRECNKQATGKKGAERKAFMKTCLSRKV